MIKKISIINYRQCIDTTFNPHPHLSVIIGKNGSGKSTLINAVRLLSTTAEPTTFSVSTIGKPNKIQFKVIYEFNKHSVNQRTTITNTSGTEDEKATNFSQIIDVTDPQNINHQIRNHNSDFLTKIKRI